ncbi:MAG: phage terminase large subunit family protein, partial [Bacillus sp. (in: Bacteria)]|nr:phage terminase large subunit family protein [Bacillus sp. (in: firmicutes)]
VKEDKTIGKAWLYMIGVDAGKERIMSGLKVKEPGARYFHFPSNFEKGYDSDYFEGLLSEKMMYKNGRWQWDKLPGHNRNEALDCRNYANAAFRVLKPNLDKINQRLKGIVVEKPERPRKKQQKRRNYMSDDW